MSKVIDWVKPFCTKERGFDGILDGFGHEFYLRFDCEPCEETETNTCDVYLAPTGEAPSCPHQFRLLVDAKRHQLLRLLFALRIVDRLPDSIKAAVYDCTSPIDR